MSVYKILAGSVREYRRESLEAPLLVSLEVVMECVIPFIVARLVNQVRTGTSLWDLTQDGALLVLMACLSLTFGILAGNACSTASCGFAKNLRSDLFRAVQGFSFENIDRFSTASLVTRLTTDVSNVQNAYMMLVRTAIRGPLMLIFSVIMAFVMGGPIAFIFLLVVPVLGTGLYAIARRAMPTFRRLFKKYDQLNTSIQEDIHNIRVVKAFVREDYERERFRTAAGELCTDFTQAERILALNNPLMQFCLYSVMLFVLYYGTYTVVTSRGLDLNVGQISSLLTYGVLILGSLMRLSMIFVMITMARESAVRIAEVLTERSTLISPPDGLRTVSDGTVDFEGVSFCYGAGARMALKDVNLHIRSGETVGILGGTGSAKSSLVQLIPRLYDATEGSVRVGGTDVRAYDLAALREQVAVVLQKNELFSGTLRDNLRWGKANATNAELDEVCRLACVDEFLSRMPDGYDTRIEQNGTNLSGGQKQRVCLARALLKRPKILILDDATSAVDTRTDARIRAALRQSFPNTTKIIIAQRILSLKDADRIVVMEGGTVSAVGTHDELLKTCAIYRETCESQKKG
ncbi:MAG: ABC transporter ATP-binding protein/permease [Fretibacterium sp.]|nr:ABC transporter ATP-binding protein/permease [Fretibacterium sp.]